MQIVKSGWTLDEQRNYCLKKHVKKPLDVTHVKTYFNCFADIWASCGKRAQANGTMTSRKHPTPPTFIIKYC